MDMIIIAVQGMYARFISSLLYAPSLIHPLSRVYIFRRDFHSCLTPFVGETVGH